MVSMSKNCQNLIKTFFSTENDMACSTVSSFLCLSQLNCDSHTHHLVRWQTSVGLCLVLKPQLDQCFFACTGNAIVCVRSRDDQNCCFPSCTSLGLKQVLKSVCLSVYHSSSYAFVLLNHSGVKVVEHL